MHHRQKDGTQHKPNVLEIVSEVIGVDSSEHDYFSYVKDNTNCRTATGAEQLACIFSKFEVYPQKWRQIPALEFKNMCVEHYAKIRKIRYNKDNRIDDSSLARSQKTKRYINLYGMIWINNQLKYVKADDYCL